MKGIEPENVRVAGSIAVSKEGIFMSGLHRIFPYVERTAAVLLVLAGSYIVYYWLFKGGLIKVFA